MEEDKDRKVEKVVKKKRYYSDTPKAKLATQHSQKLQFLMMHSTYYEFEKQRIGFNVQVLRTMLNIVWKN